VGKQERATRKTNAVLVVVWWQRQVSKQGRHVQEGKTRRDGQAHTSTRYGEGIYKSRCIKYAHSAAADGDDNAHSKSKGKQAESRALVKATKASASGVLASDEAM